MHTKSIGTFFLGWLVPGLGHITLKKYWRGITFFICIACMTTLGLLYEGRIYSFQTENPLTTLAFFSDIGNALFYLSSRLFSFGIGNLKNVTFEFGTAYLAGAGLLNYLIALDAYDIASGKKK